ncbi:MAG: hypothetical protein AB7E80_09565 [Hyphomicrobiaceae bacterium]
MTGGLIRKTSFAAMVAAAGLVMGGISSAQAADLGGDCCADLEERIAELEATTARKGNRKVSLEVSGQVNELVFFWDDGLESNVYQATNSYSSSRFRFKGSAAITADWSAGYYIEIDFEGAIGSSVTQFDDDPARQPRLRHSAWYLKSKTLGEVWVGQTSHATDDIVLYSLGGTSPATASNHNSTAGAGFRFHISGTNTYLNLSGAQLWQFLDTDRGNVVRYNSPSLAGFVLSAAWGEDDVWDVALRYAGEFNGVKIAGGIGYYENNENGARRNYIADVPADYDEIRGSVSIIHTPTGLFANFAAIHREFDLIGKSDFNYWYVAGGIYQRFFALGKTSIYGEYSEATGALEGLVIGAANNILNANGVAVANVGAGQVVTNSDITSWGFGISQDIDAAAMQLYLGYRAWEADFAATGVGAAPLDTIHTVYTGAVIKF